MGKFQFPITIWNIFEENKQNICLTTFESGIYKFEVNMFKNITLPNVGFLPTYNIIEDSEHSLWFASSCGLEEIKDDENAIVQRQNAKNIDLVLAFIKKNKSSY